MRLLNYFQMLDLSRSFKFSACLKLYLASALPVRGYFHQMKTRAAGRLAIVDVGWQGWGQDLLAMHFPDLEPLRGFYLGYSGSPQDPSLKSGWIYDFNKQKGSQTLSTHQRVFEVLIGGVSGPHQGYQQVDGIWEATFEAEEKGESAPGRKRAQSAALEFVRLVAYEVYSDWWTQEALERFSSYNLDRLFLNPTEEDAKQIDSWSAPTDDSHLDSVPLARGYNVSRIQACL